MQIKFSKMYPKLSVPGSSTARIAKAELLQVIRMDMRDFTKEFLAYDTNKNAYRLPDRGIFLLLIFRKVTGSKINGEDLFTTVRSATKGKDFYYKSCVGKIFDVKIVKTRSQKLAEGTPSMLDLSPDSQSTLTSEEANRAND